MRAATVRKKVTRAGLVGDAAGRHRRGHTGEYNFTDRVTRLACVTEGLGIFNGSASHRLFWLQAFNDLVNQGAGAIGQSAIRRRIGNSPLGLPNICGVPDCAAEARQ